MEANKNTPKIIWRIAATTSALFIAWLFSPSFWYWAGFEIIASALVIIGCSGEWYLHHHPAGRLKRQKDEHHKTESRFIAAVVMGVCMELFAVAHSIRQGVMLESEIAMTQFRISTNEILTAEAKRDAALAAERAAKFDADRALIAKEAEEIRSTNLDLSIQLEKLKSPRMISPESHAAFVNMLKGNGDKYPVWVISSSGSDETASFARQLRAALDDAGYAVSKAYKWYDNPSKDPPLSFLWGSSFNVSGGIIILPGPLLVPKSNQDLTVLVSGKALVSEDSCGHNLCSALKLININAIFSTMAPLKGDEIAIFVSSKSGF